MNWLCLLGVHNWLYGPVRLDYVNGKMAKYNVQERMCTCCRKASRVMLDN